MEIATSAMALTKRQFTKEIICVIGSLNTSDPGNVFDSIAKVKRNVCFESDVIFTLIYTILLLYFL